MCIKKLQTVIKKEQDVRNTILNGITGSIRGKKIGKHTVLCVYINTVNDDIWKFFTFDPSSLKHKGEIAVYIGQNK